MPTYTFKLILAGPEAVEKDIDKALYDRVFFADVETLLKGCAGIECLQYSRESPSLKEAVFATVKELELLHPETAVIRVLAAPAPQYSETDRRFALNPPRGHAIAKIVREHGRIGQAKDLPPLSDALLKHWILSWFRQTKSWPTAGSGAIPGSDGEHWIDIDRALENGERGLPAARSLAKYIAHHWGGDFGKSPHPSSYVHCGDTIFCLGSVQAVITGDVYHETAGGFHYRARLLIAGEWVDFYGENAHRVRDYLAQAWIAQRQFVHLDAPPQEPPPTATAETQPSQPETIPETTPQPEPEPESEKRRYFL
jgi:hypothetical protein